MIRKILVGLGAALLWPTCAHAEWREAQSEHFVIYADQSESEITRFSQDLERYHAAMALLLQRDDVVPSPSNRVTVYAVGSDSEVRDLYGPKSQMVGAFYIPRLGGSLAIVPRVKSGSGEIGWSMVALLHEYAHHFQLSSSATMYPHWFTEGSAEFFASSQFERDGSLSIGRAAVHRAEDLFDAFSHGQDASAADLLDPERAEKSKRSPFTAFYGKSWLLYHYLTFEKERAGQLNRYLSLLQSGAGQKDAAVQAFGDLDVLERELDKYFKRGKTLSFVLSPERLKIGTVTVRAMREGEAEAMPVRIRSQRGVSDGKEAADLLTEARKLAARYPEDPAVLTVLAECAQDADSHAEAIAAADAALARDKGQVNAYVQKGKALFDIARNAPGDQKAAAYKAATAPFLALNRLENDHPLPLYYFYLAQVEQGQKPSALAMDALRQALGLAPFDSDLRVKLGTALIGLNRQAEAHKVLEPAAANAHDSGATQAARKILAKLDASPTWDGHDMASVLAEGEKQETADSDAAGNRSR